jgi:hypothetical protein
LDTPDKYPDSFHLILNCEMKNNESPSASEEPWYDHREFGLALSNDYRSLLFSSSDEMNNIIKIYGKFEKTSHLYLLHYPV